MVSFKSVLGRIPAKNHSNAPILPLNSPSNALGFMLSYEQRPDSLILLQVSTLALGARVETQLATRQERAHSS